MSPIDEIGRAAWLELLAEECAELAHAALKYARVIRGENPTPASEDDAHKMLIEEIGDVEVTIDELYQSAVFDLDRLDVMNIKYIKKKRLLKRIEEKEIKK